MYSSIIKTFIKEYDTLLHTPTNVRFSPETLNALRKKLQPEIELLKSYEPQLYDNQSLDFQQLVKIQRVIFKMINHHQLFHTTIYKPLLLLLTLAAQNKPWTQRGIVAVSFTISNADAILIAKLNHLVQNKLTDLKGVL